MEWRLDLDPRTRAGQTPLHLAAAHGHGKVVQVVPRSLRACSTPLHALIGACSPRASPARHAPHPDPAQALLRAPYISLHLPTSPHISPHLPYISRAGLAARAGHLAPRRDGRQGLARGDALTPTLTLTRTLTLPLTTREVMLDARDARQRTPADLARAEVYLL